MASRIRQKKVFTRHRDGSLTISSPAKINLYLNILGKYRDGFHEIESVIQRVSLCDELTIATRSDQKIQFTCSDERLLSNDNLCLQAARLIRKEVGTRKGLDIHLKKMIPYGSGLGGASSNAAFTLLGIKRLLNLKLSSSDLYSLGERLGSDVNFFLSQSPFAYVRGRGECVRPLEIKRMFNYVIIFPRIFLSTRRVYQERQQELTRFFNRAKILIYSLKKRDFSLIERSIFNALEKSAFSLAPRLRRIRDELKRQGFCVHMTGSGSALYVLSEKAHNVKTKLKAFLGRGWFVYPAQSF